MSGFKFRELSPLGYWVDCFASTWDDHICQGHPIMKNNVKAVCDTIKNPEYVYKDSDHPDKRSVYYSKSESATYGSSLWTTVVIDNPDKYNETGNVVTSWPQKKIKPAHKKGGAIYAKSQSGSSE